VRGGDGGWIDQSKSARGRLGFVRVGGMVVEVAFITNPSEYARYQAHKWNVASAIVNALTLKTVMPSKAEAL
jgi:N-acetylmuramoyl-L-alanine amidase